MKKCDIPKIEISDFERHYLRQLDEKQRRLYLGLKAQELGRYGVGQVSLAFEVNIKTIRKGKKELLELPESPTKRIRRTGGGAKKNLRSE